MKNDLLKFKQQIAENKVNKPFNKNKKVSPSNIIDRMDCKEEHRFALCYKTNSGHLVLGQQWRHLIELDDEDIKYLSKKYLKGLRSEMQTKIDAIKAEYKEDIE